MEYPLEILFTDFDPTELIHIQRSALVSLSFDFLAITLYLNAIFFSFSFGEAFEVLADCKNST